MTEQFPLTQTLYAVVPAVEPEINEYYVLMPATAANADFEAAVCVAPFAGSVSEVTYLADTAITGANTDSRTLQVFNRGADGSGTTKVAEIALTSGVDAAQWDEKTVTLQAAGNLVVAAGDVLTFKSLHVGSTGLADPGGTVKIKIRRLADVETTVCVAPFAGTVTEVTYAPDTAITGANTNSRTVSLINKGAAGSGTASVAALAFTSGVNATAFDEKALTLDTTDATSDGVYENRVVAAGDVLAFKSAAVGTGLNDPGGTVKVVISRD